MVPVFLQEATEMMTAIREGLAQQNASQIQRSAHTIKGTSGIFAAQRVVAAALELEMIAKQGRLAEVEEPATILEQELERFTALLCAAATVPKP
jgi:HPt (histidine-containing phosphotransfer) domain-containing protein